MSTTRADADGDAWARRALQVLSADRSKPAAARLVEWPGWFASQSRIVLLDESRNPTGSLKHDTMRLAFRRLVCERTLRLGRRVVVASAGNAAIAAAHWSRVLSLPCTVVVPASTPAEKTRLIRDEHATVVPHTPPAAIYDEAERIAERTDGFYLDHFTHAPSAATGPDWPLADNLVEAIRAATGAHPTAVVVGLGSGATAAGLHAHRQRNGLDYRIIGVDAENSAYLPGWLYRVEGYGTGMPTRIEGLGRPVLPQSFDPESVDLIVQPPDAASIAGARQLRTLLDRPVGASTGATLWAAIRHARRAVRPERIATILADARSHSIDTVHQDSWCLKRGLDPQAFINHFRKDC